MTATTEQSDAITTAHQIRDHVTVLANALALIRLGHDPAPALRMAARQLDALARLADSLHDPTGCACGQADSPVMFTPEPTR